MQFTRLNIELNKKNERKYLGLSLINYEFKLYNKMVVYVARDWLGIHLSAARPTLEKSINKQGLYEWQSKSITMYPVELHRAINEYVHKNNSPKVNEVITLEITFNFTEL